MESFDATSAEAASALARSIDLPVGGCFIATAAMIDSFFMNQTPEAERKVSSLKLDVFKAFSSAFDVWKLDFVVSLSSIVTFLGNAGQSSYAA